MDEMAACEWVYGWERFYELGYKWGIGGARIAAGRGCA